MAKTTGRTGLVTAGFGWGAALGIALGALVLAPSIPGTADVGFGDHAKGATAAQEAGDDPALRDAQQRAEAAEDLLAEESVSIVAGALKDVPVTIVRTAAAADEDVEAVRWLLNAAGASDAGELKLTERFTDQSAADELSSIVANTLPAGAQLSVENRAPGAHAGESLSAVLFEDPAKGASRVDAAERTLVLESLQQAGYVDFRGSVVPARKIVVVDGRRDGSDGGEFAQKMVGDFAEGLASGGTTVLANAEHDPGEVRGVKVVGGVDTETGRISAVLAATS